MSVGIATTGRGTDNPDDLAKLLASAGYTLLHEDPLPPELDLASYAEIVRLYEHAERSRRELDSAIEGMEAQLRQMHLEIDTRAGTREAASSRPRERRPSARRAVRGGSRGDPDSPGDHPRFSLAAARGRVEDSGDTDLNLVWAEARGRFETETEYRTLARLCAIRARQLRGWQR
ncbi:MAG TPA: hypothetical protein VHS27_14990 [Gaiellales bacterium]|jgi:hypothetical protein|nr:hypothetical protein [Gaiellales bacterium]